jgi:lipopolysaccharide/colanic/teichoic acid biosynthesis glycosyltransferase
MRTFNPTLLHTIETSTWTRSTTANLPECILKWRQQQLIVMLKPRVSRSSPHSNSYSNSHSGHQVFPPPLADRAWLIECLKHSPVRLVRVDANLSEARLKFWADACGKAGKTMYLRLPSASHLPHKRIGVLWGCKRAFDWSLATLMVLALSPVMLAIVVLMKIYNPGPILFRQWRVGQRGKLFRVLKFRTMIVGAEQTHHHIMAGQSQTSLHKREDDPRITPLGRWMRKYSLDELPQLINVLQGEMSLVGPRPWALYDAVRIRPEMQERLNALPGITGAWQVEARSTLLDIDKVNDRDLEYLRNWSLLGDFKILLKTLPKVLSGFGAC